MAAALKAGGDREQGAKDQGQTTLGFALFAKSGKLSNRDMCSLTWGQLQGAQSSRHSQAGKRKGQEGTKKHGCRVTGRARRGKEPHEGSFLD